MNVSFGVFLYAAAFMCSMCCNFLCVDECFIFWYMVEWSFSEH